MPIDKVWIYRLLFVCVCVCLSVWLRISLPRIKLVASNFAQRFIGVQGRESPIWGTLPKIKRIGAEPSLQAGADWSHSDFLFIVQ